VQLRRKKKIPAIPPKDEKRSGGERSAEVDAVGRGGGKQKKKKTEQKEVNSTLIGGWIPRTEQQVVGRIASNASGQLEGGSSVEIKEGHLARGIGDTQAEEKKVRGRS